MSTKTKIEWCDYSWSPWEGCTKVSPGCANCYAEANNARWRAGANWGRGKPRRRTVNWGAPKRWNAEAQAQGKRISVFPSICDWLDEEVPIEWLADFLKLIHETPHLVWLMLTKRPENFFRRLTVVNCQPVTGLIDRAKRKAHLNESVESWCSTVAAWLEFWRTGAQVPENVWIGTSVEDQQRADERIPELLKIPARVRFLSVEPLLGPVDLRLHERVGLHLVIVGGESGPKSRPCNVAWVRDIVRQCNAASVPCFVKQLGAFCIEENGSQRRRILLDHPKGGDPAEWPADLRVRQFPETSI